ncbi:hypothetical protein P8S55_08445 [Halomonas sp. M1]|uniref:phage head spike fiber domain-containing protein n=1 Tax=Halomonas sp. M1 TaxID=3035470 RepID=UPI0024854C86|nr:hypothetical protein [Halomonas sp. M1]WFE73114.1 hypothetical protein P8S55_08445 [Halomonas sp. M1]
MASVTFPVALGGDGKTYTDDAHPDTGLDGLGYTTRFIPCLRQTVAMAGYTAQYAVKIDAAAANADRAEDASTTAQGHALTAAGYAEQIQAKFAPVIQPGLELDFYKNQYWSLSDEGLQQQTFSTLVPDFSRLSETERDGPFCRREVVPADVPHFSYDPLTGVRRGLLIEPPSTNLLTHSEDFAASPWQKIGLTVDTVGVSHKLVETVTSSQSRLRRDISVTSVSRGVSYSVDVLPDENRRAIAVLVRAITGDDALPGALVQFDLVNDTASLNALDNGDARATIKRRRDGYVRCTVSVILRNYTGVVGTNIYFGPTGGNGNATYIGDGVSGVRVRRASFEPFADPTSTILTGGAQVSRTEDLFSLDVGSLANSESGTLYLSFQPLAILTGRSGFDQTIIALNNGTQNEQVDLRFVTELIAFRVRSGGVNRVSVGKSGVDLSVPVRVALGWSQNAAYLCINGEIYWYDPSLQGARPASLTQLELAQRTGPPVSQMLFRRISIYPVMLPVSDAVALTV